MLYKEKSTLWLKKAAELTNTMYQSIPSTNPIIFYPSMLHNFAVAMYPLYEPHHFLSINAA
jgi:hypothetical protein